MSEQQKVVVVGLGYIGLPTAVVLANYGSRVHGVDINEANVERINRGEIPFVEPGLEEQLARAQQEEEKLHAQLAEQAGDFERLATLDARLREVTVEREALEEEWLEAAESLE